MLNPLQIDWLKLGQTSVGFGIVVDEHCIQGRIMEIGHSSFQKGALGNTDSVDKYRTTTDIFSLATLTARDEYLALFFSKEKKEKFMEYISTE
jgi:hypothetical protein